MVVLVTTLVQVQCIDKCTQRYTIIPGPTPRDGRDGVQGVPGTTGDKGDRGDVGPAGPKGDPGVPGRNGTSDKGDRGDIGPAGPKGDPGVPGRNGTGDKGDRGDVGPDGPKGDPGVPGQNGTGGKGDRGDVGPAGPKGDPGSVSITEEDLNRVSDNITAKVNESIIPELLDTIQTLNKTLTDRLLRLESQIRVTVCNITSANWRRIAYFDTTLGDPCPAGLRTVTNTTTNQTACGRTGSSLGCNNLSFSSMGNYSKVCGKVRGYQHSDTAAFYPYYFGSQTTIDSTYTAGISITQGSPRQHLWTYAAGFAESLYGAYYACPCARSDYNPSWIPTFVGNNYYCEAGLIDNDQRRTIWEDPLWDGNGCFAANNTCCNHYGWFYQDVQESSKFVEVRLCGYFSGYDTTDVPLDQVEIWVM